MTMITTSVRNKVTRELLLFGPNIGLAAQQVLTSLQQLTGVTTVTLDADVIRLQSSYVTLGCELRAEVEALLEKG